MKRVIYITFGTFSLGLGILGIITPGLPTTVFLLISSFFYVRSSKRMYGWLVNHPRLGKTLREWDEHKSITMRTRRTALISMWTAILISSALMYGRWIIMAIIISMGALGTVVLLMVPVRKNDAADKQDDTP